MKRVRASLANDQLFASTFPVYRFIPAVIRIMQGFSERFHAMNPGVFSCSETAWVLSFALMMLNTDMYNRNIRVSFGESRREAARLLRARWKTGV